MDRTNSLFTVARQLSSLLPSTSTWVATITVIRPEFEAATSPLNMVHSPTSLWMQEKKKAQTVRVKDLADRVIASSPSLHGRFFQVCLAAVFT